MIEKKLLSVKMPKTLHNEFFEYCKENGTNANAKVKDWINNREIIDDKLKLKPSISSIKSSAGSNQILPIAASVLIGLPAGIFVASKVKEQVQLHHPEYALKKVNLISTGYGTLVGVITSVIIYAIIGEIVK